jgi:hypothetical protein
VRPRDNEPWGSIITKQTDDASWDHVLYASDDVGHPAGFMTEDGSTEHAVTAASGLPADAWSHLALSSNGVTQTLYVNGQPVASAAAVVSRASRGSIQIGGNTLWGDGFNGDVDDVQAYNHSLTGLQIQAAMDRATENTTRVSGTDDSNSPLVIAPSGDPDVGGLPTRSPMASIQRMPVTKAVDEVTLGDLSEPASCTTQYELRVSAYAPGVGWGDADQQASFGSVGKQSLPTSLGKVSFPVADGLFRKGWGYAFTLLSDDNGCAGSQLRTWQHTGLLNGGDNPCQIIDPVAYGDDYYIDMRMWHYTGISDAVNCPFLPPNNFEQSMPGGWLDVNHANSPYSFIWTGNSTYHACDGSDNNGVIAESWTVHNPTGYVCAYANFTPPGITVPNGWYWGRPTWPTRNGQPRDTYLKLDTIDYGDLLDQHRPILEYDPGEEYPADSPAVETDMPGNRLARQGDDLINPDFDLGFLGSTYKDGVHASADDFLDEKGDNTYSGDLHAFENEHPEFTNKAYGHVAYDADGHLWLQYWLYYYYDDQDAVGQGAHEGDWETIQIRLNSSMLPDKATYSEHTGGQSRDWGDVTTDPSGDRPIAKVARSSHAAYFEGTQNVRTPCPTDHFGGNEDDRAYPDVVEIKSDSPRWVMWPGRWGSSTGAPAGGGNSPPGPAQHTDAWTDPGAWAAGLSTNTCPL